MTIFIEQLKNTEMHSDFIGNLNKVLQCSKREHDLIGWSESAAMQQKLLSLRGCSVCINHKIDKTSKEYINWTIN